MHELILGGQKSGKSRRAESLAQQWLQQSPSHQALLLATAQAHDAQMQQRIDRHRAQRQQSVPGLQTLEEPLALADAIARHSNPQTLLVVDCLTLWLTNWLMPAQPLGSDGEGDNASAFARQQQQLLEALAQARGEVVLVSNEIGWGVIPLGEAVRDFVDQLGSLNQQIAQACSRVTLMAAGLPLVLKDDTP